MSIEPADRLYDLLPAVHRWRDEEQRGPLRDLLRLITEQVDVVEADIERLYDNLFVETAEDWALPYIGELVGWAPVPEAGLAGPAPRRDVANTLQHRRRKGTLALLEELAADVADWPARAVETARLLSFAQALNHLRPDRGRSADLRNVDALDRIDGAFDELAHTVDVRRVSSHRTGGRHNLPEIAVFLWRLQAYSVTDAPAYLAEQAGRHCFTFSLLGNDAPLFTRPDPEPDDFHLAAEPNVPAPIRRLALEAREPGRPATEAHASTRYYGEGRSIALWAPGWPDDGSPQPVPVERVVAADLTDWAYRPRRGTVAVDPELGRIMFPPRQAPRDGVRVTYHYGFGGDVGGGEYERRHKGPSPHTLSTITRADLVDPAALVARLAAGADPLSRYLTDAWSTAHRSLLDEAGDGDPGDELIAALIDELNLALGDARLFDRSRFPAAPPELEAAALADPVGVRLALLNRRLLEHELPLATAMWRATATTTGELRAALAEWRELAPRRAEIELDASDVFSTSIELDLAPAQELALRAAPGRRPVLWLLDRDASRPDSMEVRLGEGAALVLDGLLVTGRAVRVEAAGPDEQPDDPDGGEEGEGDGDAPDDPGCPGTRRVVVRHCTLVPGWTLHHDCEPVSPREPSLELVDLGGACVEIDRTITGPIEVTAEDDAVRPLCLTVTDSVVDATGSERLAVRAQGGGYAHAELTIAGSTVFGSVLVHAVALATNTIFDGRLVVARRQVGCVRYCSLPAGSRTPRRYSCQADLATFTSRRYGRPGYAQLGLTAPAEITRGADDESELGVFHHLHQPQRMAGLEARLDEHTVAGMTVGLVVVT